MVGNHGSGTTMLRVALNNHRNIFSYPMETRIIPYYLKKAEKLGNLENVETYEGLWNDFRSEYTFLKANGGLPVPMPANWKEQKREISTIVDAVFKYFAQHESKTRWCEKTPMHALHMTALHKTFPGAKFIHVIRDGREAAASFHRRWGYSPKLTIYRWKRVIEESHRQSLCLGNSYYEVRYEELTNDPERYLKEICAFLDEPFDKAMLTIPRQTRNLLQGTIVENSNKWERYFDANQIAKLEGIAGKALHDLGYGVTGIRGEKNLASFERVWLMVRDYTARGSRSLNSSLFGSSNRSSHKSKKISRFIKDAVRQRITTKF